MAKLSEFFRTEYNRLVRFVRRRIDDAADRDAEDIVQDVMLNLFDNLDFAAPIENLSAYIYQSLRNRITDMFRKRKETMLFREIVQLSADDTEKVIERRELKHKIYDAIDALSDDQRAVLDIGQNTLPYSIGRCSLSNGNYYYHLTDLGIAQYYTEGSPSHKSRYLLEPCLGSF